MKKILLLNVAILFISQLSLFAYNYLSVGDPRESSWYYTTGTIEQAVLSVKPKGLYMEYGLYLTFSARGTYYELTDTLEIVLNFELPEGAIVNDSWLWIGDDIVQAEILDKWTASLIYEGIVKRRRDPSILIKQSQNQYELRIFPMAANQTRKVKITYLVPADWNNEKVSAAIPFSLIQTSSNTVEKFSILTWTDDVWKNPVIENSSSISFIEKTDAEFGIYNLAEIGPEFYYDNLKISFNSPIKDGCFLSEYTNGEDGTYQLAFLPSYFLGTSSSQKIAVLIDFDASNTTMNASEILTNTKNELLYNLNDKDSFNLILSNLSIARASEDWLPADSLTIVTAFSNLSSLLSNYSNFVPLLFNGINFVKNNGNNGKIILISNSDQYGEASVANPLIEDILDEMDPIIPIHIADYQSINYPYYWMGGTYYYGNEYFYLNLSKLTSGSFFKIRDGYSFSELLDFSLQNLGGAIKSFDLYTKLSSGFCYSRYNINSSSSLAYINKPILQVGKFKGTFPFEIEFTGEYNSEIISEDIVIQTPDIVTGDSVSEVIWSGHYIHNLESQQQTNDVVNEIIYNSIDNRILSLYTAFLCVEDTALICNDCEDETDIIYDGIETIQINTDSTLLAFPNPFDNQVTIRINNLKSIDNQKTSIKIFDTKGTLVFVCPPLSGNEPNEFEFVWDGTNINGAALTGGIYILQLQSPSLTKTLKLVKR